MGVNHAYRHLLRQVLAIEADLKGRTPAAHEPPPEPKNADEVLAALASRYRPGDQVGLQHVVECIGITWEHARSVRAWAQYHGAWPYVLPAPARPDGRTGPVPRKPPRRRTRTRKGGGS